MVKYTFYGLFISLLIGLASCGGDDNGCTDPTSDNFDAEALLDDGTCTSYNRDRFFSNYLGEFGCSNPVFTERLDNDSLMFSISEPVDITDAFEVILTLQIDGIPVNLEGNVSANTLTIDDTLQNFTIPNFLPLGMDTIDITVDVIGLGNAVISDDEQTIEGPLNLRLEFTDGSGFIEDDCFLVGERL